METIANNLRKASQYAKEGIANYTMEEMCAKYKFTRKQFQENLIIKDTSYHYGITTTFIMHKVVETEKEIDTVDNLKIRIKIKDNTKPQEINNTKRVRQPIKQINNLKQNLVDKETPMLDIKPTYGVTYNTGGKIMEGFDYESNPILKKLSLKQYYALCGTKASIVSSPNVINMTTEENQLNVYGEDKSAMRSTTYKYYRRKKYNEVKSHRAESMIQTYYGSHTSGTEPSIKRNAIITPQKIRPDTRLKTFRLRRFRILTTARKNRKLVPPPVGLTTEHGVLTA
jgi:hypothetical protein